MASRRWLGERLRSAAARVDGEVHQSPVEKRVQTWVDCDGDATLRLDYPLGPASIVLDVGGFKGQWASDIHGRFGCRVFVFEPVPEFATNLVRRFEMNPAIEILPFGLGGQTRDAALWVQGDGSSVVLRESDEAIPVHLVAASEFLRNRGLAPVDLIKVNIEGGEYELLDHLMNEGLISTISHLQVQFHDFVPDAAARRDMIIRRLNSTHQCQWSYPFVWESWSLRSR